MSLERGKKSLKPEKTHDRASPPASFPEASSSAE